MYPYPTLLRGSAQNDLNDHPMTVSGYSLSDIVGILYYSYSISTIDL